MNKSTELKKDIENKDDVKLLINTFYDSVNKNPKLSYIFNKVAKVNWETHMPRMYAFWESMLLGEQNYDGNPMEVHIALSKMTPLTEIEFDEWLSLFTNSIDDLFEGKTANEAKQRAGNIASLMLFKIQKV
jgi:hemoglobin